MSDQTQPDAAMETAPHKRRLRRKLLWGLLVLILLIIAADVGLRVGAGLGNPILYQTDAACGYLPVPNQHIRRFGCMNIINAQSQRSAAFPAAKPPGTLRILLLGDSVTYGTTHVDQGEIFASLLARDLPQKLGKPVEVLNASTGAWAVANEVGYLKSRGTFDADQVIFVLNTGDLAQHFNPGNLTSVGGYPTQKPLCALSELWVRYLSPRIFHRPAAHDAGSTTGPAVVADPSILPNLADALALCRRSGATMKIVYSPCVGPGWEAAPYPTLLKEMKQWAADHEVPFLDLKDAYAAAPAAEVYQDGVHLRPKGNALAAGRIEGWMGK